MVQESEKYADEDKKRREQIETRNRADSLAHSVEKSLVDLKGKVSDDKLGTIEGKLRELRDAIDRDDHELITERVTALETAMREIASEAYSAAGAAAPGGAAPGGAPKGKGGDDVIDAEFEDAN